MHTLSCFVCVFVGARQSHQVKIVQARSVETAHHVHYIIHNDRFVESTRAGRFTKSLNLGPFSLVDVKRKQIIETLLFGVYSAKNENIFATSHR